MRIVLILVLSAFSSLSYAQLDTIPFRLTDFNNIIVEAILNKSDTLDLMFHTAVNSVSLTEEAEKRIKYRLEKENTTVESWGGSSDAEYIQNNYLTIGNYSSDSTTVWLSQRSGQESDGKFGPNFWSGRLIKIDFEQEHLHILEELPKEMNGYEEYEVEIQRGSMFLQGRCFNGKHWHTNQFMIHTGYAGTILLDDGFAEKSDMRLLRVTDESELRDSYGNVLKKKKAIMPQFEVGGIQFEDLPMGFFEGKIGNQKTSVMGGELLKRFNIIIDEKESKIYLKPNALMNLSLKDV